MTYLSQSGVKLHGCDAIVAKEWASHLDMRNVSPHTVFMLSCRKSVWIRSLTLLGLVLLFVVMAGDSFAQMDRYLTVGQDAIENYNFPYLSPDLNQRNILINAFSFQMSLFGAISGASGSDTLPALQLLGITGLLVGALMIIFNPKHRKIPVLATWLLLVVIVILAPYGSQYLFKPLSSAKFSGAMDSTVADCKGANFVACGFAPQLAGIHVASILQVTLSDMFASRQWKGIIEQSLAESSLKNDDKLDAGNAWLARLSALQKPQNCGPVRWEDLAQYRIDPSSVPEGRKAAASMASQWTMLRDTFSRSGPNGEVQALTSPPTAIVLFDEQTIPDVWLTGSDEVQANTKNDYATGIDTIYHELGGDANTTVAFGGSGANVIPVSKALDELAQKGFFSPKVKNSDGWFSGSSYGPGIVFLRATDKQVNVAKPVDISEDTTIQARQCYYSRPAGCYGEHSGAAHASFFKELVDNARANAANGETAQSLTYSASDRSTMMKALTRITGLNNQDVLSELTRMPVGIASYKILGLEGNTVEIRPVVDCMQSYNDLVDEALISTVGKAGKARDLERLRVMLMDSKELPKATKQKVRSIDTDQIWESCKYKNCAANQQAGQGFAVDLIEVFDRAQSNVMNSTGKTELDEKERYKVMLAVVMDSIYSSTNSRRTSEAEQGAAAANEKLDIVGFDGLTTFGGGAAIIFGKVLAGIGSFFTGPLAHAIVYFMNILVSMALLMLIVMTPILFVIGLAMPGAAMGLLTIAILGAFILKLTPVTLLILNNIGGMIYDMIGVGGGDNKGVMQSLMILAMAGLYANVVGMTFFMLFKLGDASTVLSKFTALDSSAKQVAERGMAAAMAAAALAATAVGGIGGAAYGRYGLGRAAANAARSLGMPEGAVQAGSAAAGIVAAREDQRKKGDGLEGVEGGNDPSSPNSGGSGGGVKTEAQMLADGTLTGPNGQKFTAEQLAFLNEPEGKAAMGDFAREHGGNLSLSQMAAGAVGMPITGENVAAPRSAAETQNNQIGGGTPSAAIPGGSGTPIAGGAQPQTIAGVATGPAAPASSQQQMVQNRLNQIEADRTAQNVTDSLQKLETIANDEILSDATRKEARDQMVALRANPSQEAIGRAEEIVGASMLINDNGLTMDGHENRTARLRNLNDDVADRLGRFNREYGGRMDELMALKVSESGLSGDQTLELERMVKVRDNLKSIDTGRLAQGEVTARLGEYDRLKDALDVKSNADKLPGYGLSAMSGLYGAFAGAGGGLSKVPVLGPMIAETLNERHQAPERARAWAAAGGYSKWSQLQSDAKRMGFYQKEMAPIAAGTQYQSMLAKGGFQGQADIVRESSNIAAAKNRTLHDAMMANKMAGSVDATMTSILKDSTVMHRIVQKVQMDQPKLDTGSQDFMKAVDKEFNLEVRNRLVASFDRTQTDFTAFMTANDVEGLGRLEAADKVHSVRAEAALMQGAAFKVDRLKGGGMRLGHVDTKDLLTHGEIETEQVGITLTPELLNNVRGLQAVKSASGKLDGMMVDNYGIVEKQYLRGDNAWNATRGMENNAQAARNFSIQDVDTDYAVAGHIKMVQGKQKFMGDRGTYETMVQFRNDSNQMVSEYVNQHLRDGTAGLNEAMKAAQAKGGTSDQIFNATRAAADKWAKTEMKKLNINMPLESIFMEATSSAAAKFKLSSEVALDNIAAQESENFLKWRRSAGDAFEAALPNVPKFDRKMRVEENGYSVDLGNASQRMAQELRKSTGQYHNQVNSIVKDVLSKHQKDGVTIDIDRTKKSIYGAISAESTSLILDQIKSQIGEQAAADFSKNIRNGVWEFANTSLSGDPAK